MVDDGRIVAARWRLRLRLGACRPEEVIAWADSQILALADPPIELIELAALVDAPALHVYTALEPLAQGVDVADVLPRVLAECHLVLLDDPGFGPHLARNLYALYVDLDYAPPSGMEDMGWFDDAYSLARAGYAEDERDVYDVLLAFTASPGVVRGAR